MLLDTYLDENRYWLSRNHFCTQIGISRPFLNSVVYGISSPSLVVAYRIVEYTRGEVSYRDLLQPFLDKHANEYLIDGRVLTGVIKNSHTPKKKKL